jgi:HPt (histidine-containing phosphotransfer) domain-containing protein
MSSTPQSPESDMRDALAHLWARRETRIRAELKELRGLMQGPPGAAKHERAGSIAHDLAGLCGVFGFVDASAAASEFEQLLSQTPGAIEMQHLSLLIDEIERSLFGNPS